MIDGHLRDSVHIPDRKKRAYSMRFITVFKPTRINRMGRTSVVGFYDAENKGGFSASAMINTEGDFEVFLNGTADATPVVYQNGIIAMMRLAVMRPNVRVTSPATARVIAK